jgi:hypothetical protein
MAPGRFGLIFDIYVELDLEVDRQRRHIAFASPRAFEPRNYLQNTAVVGPRLGVVGTFPTLLASGTP